jgi:hypothetical protein
MDEERCVASLEGEHIWSIDKIERKGGTLFLKESCCLCSEQRVECQENKLVEEEPEPQDSGMTFFRAISSVCEELPMVLFFYVVTLMEMALSGDDDE